MLRVLGRIPTGSAFAALPLALGIAAVSWDCVPLIVGCGAVLGVTLLWTFAPWIPGVRSLVPGHRRIAQIDALWLRGHDLVFAEVESDEEWSEWKGKVAAWCWETANWIKDRVSAVEAQRFSRVGGPARFTKGNFNDEHASLRSGLNYQLEELMRLRADEQTRLR